MIFLKEYFARRIVTRRLEIDIPRIELARRAGVVDPTIISIERGDTQPSMETFARLCEVLDFFPSIFFDRSKSVITPGKAPEPVREMEDRPSG